MGVKTFDFKRVSASVNGVPVKGFIDGDGISIEFDEDSWSMVTGADDTVTRTRSNKNTGKITMRLANSSDTNAVFDALAKLDKATGLGVLTIYIFDALGGSTYVTNDAWSVKDPGKTMGVELGSMEWVFQFASITHSHKGNIGLN
jgi:hypothetical protein